VERLRPGPRHEGRSLRLRSLPLRTNFFNRLSLIAVEESLDRTQNIFHLKYFIMPKLTVFLNFVLLGAVPSLLAQTPRIQPPQMAARPSATSSDNSSPSVQQDVSYGTVDGQSLLLDVYEPGEHSDLRPAIVLIHGGGWTSFDKGTMRAMGMFLARSGFVAFSVDYRLFHGSENRWPAQLDDVQRAVRWIRANAAKYKIDPDHIGAFGHSAGAQLAALLGMEATRDNSDAALAKYSSQVQAVVDVSGPSDFTTDHDPEGNAFLSAFLGGDFAHHPEIWRDASPVFHISKSNSPFLIVHGTQDSDVPMAQAEELADELKGAGVSVKLVKIEDGHTFRMPEARKQLAFETQTFFFQHLRP
jgi:acetyl esterase/lipase